VDSDNKERMKEIHIFDAVMNEVEGNQRCRTVAITSYVGINTRLK
jgi:hypothetical protein